MKTTNIFSALAAFLTAALFASPAFAILGQPEPGGLGLAAAASPMKEKMNAFHNNLLLPITAAISIFVFLLLIVIILRFNRKANPTPSVTTHNTILEVVWTIAPVLILVVIAVPSLKMLYYIDKTAEAEMTLKVTGYQWYWGYEYPDNGGINFLSNMVADKDLKKGQPRLLATDNAVVLPVDTNVRLLITAADVLHAWAVPAFGVKMDAVPGRLNETWVRIDKEGTFYGQCSELCGANHGFMPIEVQAVSKEAFAAWVQKQGGQMPVRGEQ
jgi:cytochrome c oxidase subunit 2